MKKNNNSEVQGEKKQSFIEKIRTDKKYSAKVQLIGFGIFILLLIIYLNVISGSSNSNQNIILGNNSSSLIEESTDDDKTSLLEKVDNNYSYDIVLDIKKKNSDVEEEKQIHYYGKSYKDNMEINKEMDGNTYLYYKVKDYYYKNGDNLELVKESYIYDIVDKEYIELDSILKLLDKASLDHVTDYSSGKREYVYHLRVKDVIVNYSQEDIIEIDILEENGIISIDIDYTSLLKVIDSSILDCELKATITQVDEVLEFEVAGLKSDESTSIE